MEPQERKRSAKPGWRQPAPGSVAMETRKRNVKKQEKEGELSEDQSRDEQDKVQKTTDKFIAELEKLLAEKEADILKV